MDMNKLSKLTAAALFAVVLAACSSSDNIDETDDPAAVDTRSDSGSESGASASGTGVEGSLEGGDLSDGAVPTKDQVAHVYYFEFDSNALTSEARADLDKVAAFMKTNSDNFQLHGHADERGTREYNLALSERRAKSVQDYLVLQGIDRSRIEIIGFGEEKPAQPDSHEEAYSKNRRVELDH